jgi:2-polyprenyl-6-methoxyphenol hydroxylase-like FAD-dependent oxidoreductase
MSTQKLTSDAGFGVGEVAATGPKLGRRRSAHGRQVTTVGEHALVLGASMGGLLAARVLAESFRRVTIVERDQMPAMPADRRGVPQGRHAHGLLPAGGRVLDELFPGLLDDFVARGVPVVREPPEMHFSPGGHKLCQEGTYAKPTPTYQPSRPYLEGQVRALVRATPNVEIIDNCDVIDLVGSPSEDRVTGARVLHRGGDGERLIGADLIIDATGRAGRAASWLVAMGYEKAAEDRLDVDIKYVSRHLRLQPESLLREKAVIVGSRPGRPTGANFLQQEGDCWVLTLIGYRGFHPPTDPDGFMEFAKSVLPADAFAAVRDAEPLDDLVAHRYHASVRRRYERLTRFPAGFLVFGDALCSFNPVYAQGMSAAALQAVALRECLARGSEDLAARFFKLAGRRIEVAWQMAIGGDLALPEVEAPRPLPARIFNAYIERLLKAAEDDWAVAERFVKVSSLIAPPTLLLSPVTVGRVVIGNWRRRSRRFGPLVNRLDQ